MSQLSTSYAEALHKRQLEESGREETREQDRREHDLELLRGLCDQYPQEAAAYVGIGTDGRPA